MQPVLLLLALSSLAAAAAALGVVPLWGRRQAPRVWLGWANSVAAGMMLAAAFVVTELAIGVSPVTYGVGGMVGIAFVHQARRFFGLENLDLDRLEKTTATYGYEVLLVGSLHSAAEGVAIGAAMAVDPSLGIFTALAMALHNIPEATVQSAIFRTRGDSLGRSAILAIIANLPLVLVAVSTFAVLAAAPTALPLSLGFAAGSLVYLVLVDLLPESYEQAGATSIALGVILAMIAFALVHAALLR